MSEILTDEERQALVQAVVRDLVREAVVKPLVANIASAFLANQGVPEIDYEALITACYERTRYAQGSKGCAAFKEGAEWFREQVLAAAPVAQQAATDWETRAELAEQQVVCLTEERDHFKSLYLASQSAAPVAQQAVPDGCKVVPLSAAVVEGDGLTGAMFVFKRREDAEALVTGLTAAPEQPAPVTCVECGGAGGWEKALSSTNYTWVECPDCTPATAPAPLPLPLTEPTEYTGVRCMCVLTGCQAGPGCPHYTEHCRKHIDHERAHGIGKGEAS